MNKQLTIDLNCDLGESFGIYKIGNDKEMMKYVSSVNIACGFHAGDPSVIRKTVNLALEANVAVGAHPGYPDLQGFGRRNINYTPEEIFDLTLYQIGALKTLVEVEGSKLHHVKPHGALYNMAAKSEEIANAIVQAILKVDEELILYGLSNSYLISEAKKLGLRVANEGFVDRTYNENGQLTPRTHQNAVITDEEASLKQVIKMISEKKVIATSGKEINIEVDTLCIHGDGAKAVEFAQNVSSILKGNNIEIKTI
ncbi:5-oxoprolinase subunit PxpA [Lysinibacillus telephonicus]|uniref:5-oxoprolinase subunit A n=1 Tax=Lysinibacillus telephonicus TaxID=1714840 RepID=A0A431UTD6_9BACI|nr:5-oxoprolinase subunit PxpA [Lysinibacillus telephonicus]RTQ93886.1 5-oxoprolinase subunit PxpA [Lysinibacillus telephonicus]